MISNDHLHDDLKTIEDAIKKETNESAKATLIAQKLIVKLLHNIRTNSVIVMKHLGIDVKSKGRPGDTETQVK